jgi:hypothetical protein
MKELLIIKRKENIYFREQNDKSLKTSLSNFLASKAAFEIPV